MTATASVRLVPGRIARRPFRPVPALLGAVPSATPLQLTVALRPQDPSGSQAFATSGVDAGLAAVSPLPDACPSSQSRFGATDQQVAAVESSLRADGLTVGDVPANHLTMPVTGTAAQVEKAFSVSLSQVKLASGPDRLRQRRSAPTLPSTISRRRGGCGRARQPRRHQPQGAAPPRPRCEAGRAGAAAGDPPRRRPAVRPPCPAAPHGHDERRRIHGRHDRLGVPVPRAYYLAGDNGAGQTDGAVRAPAVRPRRTSRSTSCATAPHVRSPTSTVDGGPGPVHAQLRATTARLRSTSSR